jgi:translation elongation factor EF-G
VEVIVHWFETTRHTSEAIIEAACSSCLRECLQEATVFLLEPIVSLEIIVEENYQRMVLDDLNRRRFLLESIDYRHGNNVSDEGLTSLDCGIDMCNNTCIFFLKTF